MKIIICLIIKIITIPSIIVDVYNIKPSLYSAEQKFS